MNIRYRLEEMENIEDRERLFFEFIKDVDKTTYDVYKSTYDELDEEGKEEFFKEIIEDRIVILQKPYFGNMELDNLFKIYDKYEIERVEFDGINKPMVYGELFHMRLRHEPDDKNSQRSVDNVNFTNQPTRTSDAKNYLAKYNNNAIRIGEQEMLNPNVSGNIDGTKTLTELYAVNPESRNRLHSSLLLGNPFNPKFDLYKKSKNSNTREIDSLFRSLNMEITNRPYKKDEFPEIRHMDTKELDEVLSFMAAFPEGDFEPEAVRHYIENNMIPGQE